ncbi:MAG: PaaI family thioesterase [Planctomycetes bacterium]|nr:PaaI family thioesterase [Planctomycetota bacterium]
MKHERERHFMTAPVGAFFGYRPGPRDARHARVSLEPRREFLQGQERVHGGILASLADTTAVWLVYPELDRGRTLTSIEFKLNFLRPATLTGGELVADATLVKLGRTIALVDVEVAQGGGLVAKGLFTYLVLEPPAAQA